MSVDYCYICGTYYDQDYNLEDHDYEEEDGLEQIYQLIASVRSNGAYPAESFIPDIISKINQKAVKNEKITTLKSIYKMLITNGSADREWILHKLSRILLSEETL